MSVELGSIIQKCLLVIYEKINAVMWSKRKIGPKERKPSTVLKSVINTISWWRLDEFLYSLLLDNTEEKSDIW